MNTVVEGGGGNAGGRAFSSPPPAQGTGGSPLRGLRAALAALGAEAMREDVFRQELLWQQQGRGDKTLAATFRDEAVAQQGVVVFGLMVPGSAHVHLLHSVAKFFGGAMGGPAEVRGKVLGFLGDDDEYGPPDLVMPQPQKAWSWAKVNWVADGVPFAAFHADPVTRGQLWAPASMPDTEELPRLLYLPTALADWAAQEPRTPFELREELTRRMTANGSQVKAAEGRLALDWCLAAGQSAGQDSSILALDCTGVKAVDRAVKKWKYDRLRMTMGDGMPPPQPQQTQHPPLPDPYAAMAQMATQLGKAVGDSLKPLARQQQRAEATVGAEGRKKTLYSAYQLNLLCGWAKVTEWRQLPRIWLEWQTTADRDEQRDMLWDRMTTWSAREGFKIDDRVYWQKDTVVEWVNLKFNPGECRGEFKTAEKGISPLLFLPVSSADRAEIMRVDAARGETESNRTLAEALSLSDKDPRAPPRSFDEMELMVATCAGFFHTLFGEDCEIYESLLSMCQNFEKKTVKALKEDYTPTKCREYTWAILDDCRQFFSVRMTERELKKRRPNFPESELDDVVADMKKAKNTFTSNFPQEWKWQHNGKAAPNAGKGLMSGGWKMEQRAGAGGGGNSNNQQWGANHNVANRNGAGGQFRAGGGGQQQGDGGGPPQGGGGGGYNKDQGGPGASGKVGRNPDAHPMVTSMMKPYFDKLGTRIQLADICTAANTRINQLPYLNRYIVGNKNMLCYPFLLGYCSHANCRFDHPPTRDIPTGFISEVCQVVRPGVEYVVKNGLDPRGGSPKKQRR